VPDVAIVGAGAIGASIAHRLALGGRSGSITLVDATGSVAAGKALDICQSGPVEHVDTKVDSSTDVLAAAAAPVVVVADEAGAGPWDGERGLGLVRRLVRAGSTATFVFACPSQTWLIEASYKEVGLAAHRLVGTASTAIVSAVRALAALELGLASVDLTVVGRPPKFVVGWTAATAGGSLLTEQVPAHRLLAISAALRRIWPPGPYAIASATAEVVEAIRSGSRRRHPAETIVDGDLGTRGTSVLLPLELGQGRVMRHFVPSLSPQERTEMVNGWSGR
jgi:hypothetical protein